MIYDTDRNITWVADANLFKSQAAANPNVIHQIIANVIKINDTPNILDNPSLSGFHNLTASDFNANTGKMSWFGAKAWADNLDYGGFSDWRLPTITDTATAGCDFAYSGTDCGYNVNTTDSELAHMYYAELGLKAPFSPSYIPSASSLNDITDWGFEDFGFNTPHNIGLVKNLFSSLYWSSAEVLFLDHENEWGFPNAWYLSYYDGSQNGSFKDNLGYAWAVRSGDVTTVPVPSAVWLFGTGLLGFLGMNRQRQA